MKHNDVEYCDQCCYFPGNGAECLSYKEYVKGAKRAKFYVVNNEGTKNERKSYLCDDHVDIYKPEYVREIVYWIDNETSSIVLRDVRHAYWPVRVFRSSSASILGETVAAFAGDKDKAMRLAQIFVDACNELEFRNAKAAE